MIFNCKSSLAFPKPELTLPKATKLFKNPSNEPLKLRNSNLVKLLSKLTRLIVFFKDFSEIYKLLIFKLISSSLGDKIFLTLTFPSKPLPSEREILIFEPTILSKLPLIFPVNDIFSSLRN